MAEAWAVTVPAADTDELRLEMSSMYFFVNSSAVNTLVSCVPELIIVMYCVSAISGLDTKPDWSPVT